VKNIYLKILSLAILLALIIEILRDAGRAGDFVGYIQAGQLVLDNKDIYSDPLNTWPPFFAVMSVPLTWLDGISSYGLRLIWLAGIIVAMAGIIQMSYELLTEQQIKWKYVFKSWSFHPAWIWIPFLISFRYLLDNLANIQINVFMLLLALGTHKLWTQGRHKSAGFLLALSISLKVYTIFLFFYYLFKRQGQLVIACIFFLVIFNLVPFLVFGWDNGIHYYAYWWQEIASPPPTAHHKNQSVFGAMLRLFTGEFPGHRYYINVLEASPETIKKASYWVIAIAAIYPAWLFRKVTTHRKTLLEIAFVMGAIPILSPLSWKAYFIFLWLSTFVAYFYIWQAPVFEGKSLKIAKTIFWSSVVLTVASTEGIAGDHFSDILESYAVITAGTLMLLGLLLMIYPGIEIDDDP
jgi:hypothetical protein